MRRSPAAVLLALALVFLAACSNDGRPPQFGNDTIPPIGGDRPGGGSTVGVDVCSLVTGEQLIVALDSALDAGPPFRNTEPAGPFTGCSWGTGWLLIQVAESDRLILPPNDSCPVAGIGDDSRRCPGHVVFHVNGIHTSVSTIENHPVEALESVANLLLPIIEAL